MKVPIVLRNLARPISFLALGAISTLATAGQLTTRSDLQSILGSGSTLDTFEAANLPPESQVGSNQNLEYLTVIQNGSIHVVSPDSQYTSSVGLFLQNILGATSTNLSAYGSQPVYFYPSGLTPAVGLDLFNYAFVGLSTGTVRFYRFGVEIGSIPWSFTGLTPQFFGWHDPLGIDEVVIEPTPLIYPPLIDNVEFKVQRPEARRFYSLELTGSNLVTIDPVTGDVDIVGSLGTTGIIDADLTWFGDYLYAAVVQSNYQVKLMKIDPSTGLVLTTLPMAPVNNYLDYVEGIAAANGRLIISTANQTPFGSHSSDALWDVDPNTGGLTNVHSFIPNDLYADLDALESAPNGDLYILDNEPGSYKRFIRAGSGPYYYNIVNVSYRLRAAINDWVLDGNVLVGPNDYTDAVATFDAATGNLLHSVSTGPGNYRGAALPPANEPPVAINDFYAVAQLGTLSEGTPGILVNDSDPDNDGLTVELLTGPSHASSFTQNASGSFTYTPVASFFGTDSYTYRVFDGTVYSDPATVTITVTQPGAQGFITGGGKFFQSGNKCTFGFVAKVVGSGVRGNLEFQDHGLGLNVKSDNVDWVYAPNGVDGYFSGTCTLNGAAGYSFFVQVHDRGEPGRNDDFSVWVFDSTGVQVYSSSGLLSSGGNIQIHQ